MIEIEQIQLVRNASQIVQVKARGYEEPTLVRRSSTGEKTQIFTVMEIKAAPVIIIQTGNDVNAAEGPMIPLCTKQLTCGHQCNGVKNEHSCPPCLDPACAPNHYKGGVNADDMCRICYTYELGAEACSRLSCGHIYHTNCLINQLKAKWSTLYYTWRFMNCPECNQEISLTRLSKPIAAELGPLIGIKKKVQAIALESAQRQGLLDDPAFSEKGSEHYGKQQKTADAKCAVYPCHECKKPFFGGLRDCENEMQQ